MVVSETKMRKALNQCSRITYVNVLKPISFISCWNGPPETCRFQARRGPHQSTFEFALVCRFPTLESAFLKKAHVERIQG